MATYYGSHNSESVISMADVRESVHPDATAVLGSAQALIDKLLRRSHSKDKTIQALSAACETFYGGKFISHLVNCSICADPYDKNLKRPV